jgi:hypothetical protein
LAAAHSLAPACVSIICLTLGLSTNFGLSNIVIQERAPHSLRGRISAVAGLSFFGLLPFSGLVTSGVVDFLGMRQAMFACTSGFVICAAILLNGVRQFASAPMSSEASPVA